MKHDINDFKYQEQDKPKPVKFKGKVSWWFYGIILGTAILLIREYPKVCVNLQTDVR